MLPWYIFVEGFHFQHRRTANNEKWDKTKHQKNRSVSRFPKR
jgi:hypothetical protein